MLWAIARGSDMGPGDGWFGPAQSRYGWSWLAERFDADKNGEVSRQEFPKGEDLFERLDRSRDGVLKAEDFDWSERSPLARKSMIPGQWFRMFDANSNGRLSPEE